MLAARFPWHVTVSHSFGAVPAPPWLHSAEGNSVLQHSPSQLHLLQHAAEIGVSAAALCSPHPACFVP